MMTEADEYRRKGDEATLAEMDSENPFVRQMHAKLAHHWHELAERVERQQAAAADSPEPPEPPEPKTAEAELAEAFDFLLANRSAAASKSQVIGEAVPAN
jgi:hypothetical protein